MDQISSKCQWLLTSPEIDHHTNYGRLTLEMCAVAQVEYHESYRSQTILFSHQIPQTGLIPNPSDDTEYIPTRHIFAQWIDDILAKFETRYPHILTCIQYLDLSMIHGFVPSTSTRCKRGTIKDPMVPLTEKYNRLVLCLRLTSAITIKQICFLRQLSVRQALFPLLHQYITNNTHLIANDAHALKHEMSHTQKRLSATKYTIR